ncbi:hypothetical protein UFOVP410_98 [uncultured Caudovirales phage]|uniref:Uncharacterized protein n=1 Tax=uncultured Caudovirales phage TaxID=2100421 RepID=A0A6J5MBZ9_9CAUD|nr:hypothetical protein UFOVP410_98 [uncultured Caudovirales phage]
MILELEKIGLSYDSLTENQKAYFLKYIWNGVGSRHFFINPHDLIFKEASVYHDFYYWRGGPLTLKKLADKDFLHRCHHSVRQQPRYKQILFYYPIAGIYYFFLKFGKKAWEKRVTPCKTWEELLEQFYTKNKNSPKYG